MTAAKLLLVADDMMSVRYVHLIKANMLRITCCFVSLLLSFTAFTF